jgi:hypothetical protein
LVIRFDHWRRGFRFPQGIRVLGIPSQSNPQKEQQIYGDRFLFHRTVLSWIFLRKNAPEQHIVVLVPGRTPAIHVPCCLTYVSAQLCFIALSRLSQAPGATKGQLQFQSVPDADITLLFAPRKSIRFR